MADDPPPIPTQKGRGVAADAANETLSTPLFTPGEPVDEPVDDVLGPWSEDALEEFMDDLEDITGAEQRAAQEHAELRFLAGG